MRRPFAVAVVFISGLVLGFYLRGGSPTAIAGGGGGGGVEKCSSQNGAEVSCGEGACPGQDGAYATGCSSEGRFVEHGDGTVTDTCTGLMWQKDTADVNGDGQSTEQDGVRWCDALAYCEDLSFADYDDWRLPNVRELQSIVDYGRFDRAIDPVFRAFSVAYWSSTTFADLPDYAWLLHFLVGLVPYDGKRFFFYVRAVRTRP